MTPEEMDRKTEGMTAEQKVEAYLQLIRSTKTQRSPSKFAFGCIPVSRWRRFCTCAMIVLLPFLCPADGDKILVGCESNKLTTAWPSRQAKLSKYIGPGSVVNPTDFSKAKAGVVWAFTYISYLGEVQNFNNGTERISKTVWKSLEGPPFVVVAFTNNEASWESWFDANSYTNVSGGVTND